MLQQPTVTAMYRDREGLLWIGTQQGLHRFDGAKLTVFDAARSNRNWIPDSEIMDIAEDGDGNLLVATSGGILLRWDPDTNKFDSIEIPGSGGKSSLLKLLASKNGSIWALGKDGLSLLNARFHDAEGWIVNLDLEKAIGRLHHFVEDKSGNIWVGGSLGLAKIDLKQRSMNSVDIKKLDLPKGTKLTALKINSQGNLVIGTNNGRLVVWRMTEQAVLASAALAGSDSSYITDLDELGDMLVVATDRGLFASNNTLSSVVALVDKGEDLSNADVYSLLHDGTRIWIGTIDGLSILSFSPFDLYNKKNSQVSNDILAFEEDRFGRMWIGTYHGLYQYVEASGLHTKVDLKLSGGKARRVATLAASNTTLWVGFLRGGLHLENIDDTHVIEPPNLALMNSISDLVVTKILTDSDNTGVWIATYDHGLFRVEAEGTRSYYQTRILPEKTITLLFPLKSKSLLAVSENRVYQYIPSTDSFNKIDFNFRLGKGRPVIYSIAQASNNDLLVGTKDYGLYIWSQEDQEMNRFNLMAVRKSDLESSTIYGIQPDSEGNLWCSTQNGIVKLDLEGRFVRRFTEADGLQGNDFALGASFISSKGLIYFGGVNGYNRFDPIAVNIDSAGSPMRLTDISLPKRDETNRLSIDTISTLQLNHKDYFVSFQFSVLDFFAPEKNQFRYKLENFDTDWVENGNRNTATYTNLPAGDYVFRVQGANSAGIWNREGITLAVQVLPAPWFSWWAYSLYGLATLFLVWSVHRIYHSYAVDRKSAQMAIQMFEAANKADDEMQEQLELQDEVIQSAFQHNRTTLSLVSDIVLLRGSNEAGENIPDVKGSGIKRIEALSILENCLYYHAGASVADLHKYTESILPIILKSSRVSPETIVTINETTSTLLPSEMATPLSIVLYELLENCVTHAFEPQSPANFIHVKIIYPHHSTPAHSSLVLLVKDSGIGLPDTLENLALEGSGIGIVQKIVKDLGGSLTSLEDTGTTISIILPIIEP